MPWLARSLGGLAFGAVLALGAAASGQSVLTYHGAPDRAGLYSVPGLTWERAAGIHLDPGFDGRIDGHVYAQPLYWAPPGSARKLLIVATEDDLVAALDAGSGKEVWRRSLGRPVQRGALPCGNISPLGITGTPAIDAARAAVYLDAMVDSPDGSGARHLVFGLALGDGAVLPGFPIDIAAALRAQGIDFAPRVQNQRGALILFDNRLFVPYGGHFGDCGAYHGWVVAIALDNPRVLAAWRTRAVGGGIWAPGGISSDGTSLFVATGNTMDARQWSDGEAVIRLGPDLKAPTNPRDFFAPADWQSLDARDADLGGTGPLPIDIRDGAATARLLLALGKDGKAYLLDRDDLGGIGGARAVAKVARRWIINAPAVYPAPNAAFVAFEGPGSDCPGGSNSGLTVLRIEAHPAPRISTAWCAPVYGRGSPIVTTTDNRSDPIVWMVGAEGDNRLHGFRGDTGAPVFQGGGSESEMKGLRHFVTILAADGRLFVAGDDRIYAFRP